jgi:hypothetical protein
VINNILSVFTTHFIQNVLSYRLRQREQKERMRQEEQERNAAHKARMQTQYGINSPSTPPNNESGSNNWGGVDTDKEDSTSWWERVKYYAQLAIERVEYGVDSVKELLSTGFHKFVALLNLAKLYWSIGQFVTDL